VDAPALRAARSVGTRLRLGRAQLALWRPTWSWVRGVVRSFVERTLGGSVSPFVTYLTEEARVSDNELAELEELVAKLQSQRKEEA